MKETMTVYEAEHFKALPKETQKLIESLSKELQVKQLNVLNPLVEAMATIEGFSKIKYQADNEESVQQYKDSKKYIGSFNASTKKAKSALKKPFLETGRKLDKIEKMFLERAKNVMQALEEEFKPYVDEQEKLKQEREEKKNKAILDKVAELSESDTKQKLVIERSKVYNKHSSENQAMLDDVMAKVETFSEMALKLELSKIEKRELVIPVEEENLLLDDQVVNLKTSFESMKKSCIRMIDLRLKEIEIEKSKPKETEEPKATNPEPPEDVIVHSHEHVKGEAFSTAFSRVMQNAVNQIEIIPVVNDREKQAKISAVGAMQGYLIKILNYLDNGDGKE